MIRVNILALMKRLCPLVLTLFLVFASQVSFSENIYGLIPKEARNDGKLGVVVMSLKTDQKILEYNPDRLFIPASNQKVITSVSALSLLGTDYRFKTEFYSGGGASNGVLYGGLYIKGYGEPSLTTEHLRLIAEEFKRRGIREIKGGIIVDDSYFDGVRYGKGWKEEWKGDFYSPAISALTLNQNTFEIRVYPSKPGRIPTVELEPRGTNINIINKATTSYRKGGITAKWYEEGKTIVLRGNISPRTSLYSIKTTVGNPALYTGSVFKRTLEEAGIKVSGLVATGEVPNWASAFYTHFSDPLYLIVTEYNKNSINIIGENLIKTLGAEFKKAPGSWEKGAQVISEFLRKTVGVKDPFTIVDGSGLSPLNQVSPKVITEILRYAYKNRFIAPHFLTSLPIAGVDGTLKHRFSTSEVRGRILAKTGYLNNVRALSGYVFTKGGDVLVFSILANGLGWKAKEFQNDLLSQLVECCGANGFKGN